MVVLAAALGCRGTVDDGLGKPQAIAPGVRLYTLSDAALADTAGPIAIQALRLEADRIRLASALANDEVMGTETVAEMAARHGALAAINAGFFAPNGDPTGVLQVDRELVSDRAAPRGAVAITTTSGRTELLFDRVTATAAISIDAAEGGGTHPVAGIDTTRQRGRLMLYTPKYHAHTDTAARGIEWVLDGSPLTVRERRVNAGSTPIPRGGAVLSYGGLDPPPPLDALGVGDEVRIVRTFETRHGSPPRAWDTAEHVIGGAGLLVREGQPLDDWAVEDLRPGFTAERHPRTMIGVDAGGDIWLVTVDGRNPQVSVGMTLAELQGLAARLRLVHALNLDGGGSTTMVVRGAVVNTPSDSSGPRKVSDALLVFPRQPHP